MRKIIVMVVSLLMINAASGEPVTNALEVNVRDGTKVFTRGANVEFEYRVNFAETAKTARVHYQIEDLFNRELVYSNEVSVALEAGKPSAGTIQYPLAMVGQFQARFAFGIDGKERSVKEIKYSVVAPKPVPMAEDSPFGLFMHSPFAPKITDAKGWRQIIDLGIKWLFYSALWDASEDSKKIVDFITKDCALNLQAYFWMNPGSCPEAYSQERLDFYKKLNGKAWNQGGALPMPDPEIYARHFLEAAAAFKGKVKTWVIFDERGGFVEYKETNDRCMEDYVNLMKAAYPAGKKADPDCMITLTTVIWIYNGADFLREYFKRGGESDGVLSSADSIPEIRKIQNEFGIKKLFKGGYSGAAVNTVERKKNPILAESKQAAAVVKEMIPMLKAGMERFFVYAYTDNGEGVGEGHGSFGLCDNTTEFTPRFAYLAYANLTRIFDGMKFQKKVDSAKGLILYAFRKPSGDGVVAAWSIDCESHILDFSATQPVKVVDLLGGETTLQPFEGRITVTVSGNPVYLCGKIDAGALKVSESSLNIRGKGMWRKGRGEVVMSLSNSVSSQAIRLMARESSDFEISPAEQTMKKEQGAIFNLMPRHILDGEEYPVTVDLYGDNKHFGLVRYVQKLSRDPLAITIIPAIKDPSETALAVTLKKNSMSVALDGYLLVEGPGADTNKVMTGRPASEETTYEIRLNKDKLLPTRNHYTVKVFNAGGAPIGKAAATLDFNVCHKFTPVMDGDTGEWTNPSQWTLNTKGRIKNFTDWKGEDDLSADVFVCWDETNFYFAAEVKDDVFSQPYENGDIWKGDSIQIAIDPAFGKKDQPFLKPSGFRYQPSDKADFWEGGLAETSNGPVVYCWKGGEAGIVKSAVLKTKRSDGKMVYEAAIPWKEIATPGPEAGEAMGFSFVIQENDGKGSKGYLEGYPGICGAGSKDKTGFGDLSLIK